MAAFVVQIGVAIVGPYDVSLVVTGTERISNVSPPTLLLALLCAWLSFAFVASASVIGRWAARPLVWRAVAVGNRGAMTLYLWHIPAIALAAFALNVFGLDAYDVHLQGFWALLVLRAVVFAAVMALAFRLLAPLEHRRLPWWDAPVRADGNSVTAAGVLVCVAGVALLLLAKNGLGDRTGLTILSGFVVAAAAARLSAAWPLRAECGSDGGVPGLLHLRSE
jgi:hypothetical protein